ncbi:MAG: NTP transferase domain-containing protein [Myxococcota bacterium]
MTSSVHPEPASAARAAFCAPRFSAVVLAAGRGARMGGEKLLTPLCGRTLLAWVVTHLRRAGAHPIHVIIRPRDEGLRAEVRALGDLVVHRAETRLNGTTCRAALDAFVGGAALVMGDHLIRPAALATVVRTGILYGGGVVGVDRRVERCPDLSDATKVELEGELVLRLGKRLPRFDALDTGVFYLGDAFRDVLAYRTRGGAEVTLTALLNQLATSSAVRAVDLSPHPWLDVDESWLIPFAERWLRGAEK